jgi:uncharacterized protein
MTTIVLMSGFFIYTLATLLCLINFGFITGVVILFALLGDILLMPAILVLIYPSKAS